MKVKSLSCVRLFATPWTVAYQAPPSMGFSRQEYWSGLPFPSPGGLPDPGIEPGSPEFQADALTSEPPVAWNTLPNLSQPTFLIWKKSTVMLMHRVAAVRVRRVWRAWYVAGAQEVSAPGLSWQLRLDAFTARSAGSIPGQGIQILHATQQDQKKKKNLSVPFFSLGPERTIRTLDLDETDLELPVTGGEVWGEATQASHGGLDPVAPSGPRMVAEQCSSVHRCSLGWKIR